MYIEGFWAKSEFTKTLKVANVEYNISTNTIWFANVNFILDILEVMFVYSSTYSIQIQALTVPAISRVFLQT